MTPIDRDLLVKALQARRLEQISDHPELRFMPSTFNGAWAQTEADRLIVHMERIQEHTAELSYVAETDSGDSTGTSR